MVKPNTKKRIPCKICGAMPSEAHRTGKNYSNVRWLCGKHHKEIHLELSKKKDKDDKDREELKRKAIILYQEGLTTRAVGDILGKSHTWVWLIVRKKLSTKS